MAEPPQKPSFSFAQILTAPLIEGMPTARARLERRTSFVVRFFRRYLTGSGRTGTRAAERQEALAKAGKMWTSAARAYQSGRIDSLVRCISGLKEVVEQVLAADGSAGAKADTDVLVRRAWQDVRAELASRLEAVEEKLAEADQQATPDRFHWIEATRDLGAYTWDERSIGFVASEVRETYGRVVWVKANLKFIALHIDEIRWLADFGANPAEAFAAVPSNWTIRQKLKRADELKAALNEHLVRMLATPMGPALRALIKPTGDGGKLGAPTPKPQRRE
jgi:hypothetical protein